MQKQRTKNGVFKRPDSPYWQIRYSDQSGKTTRISSGTADRKAAEALAAKLRMEAYQSRHFDVPVPRSFDEVLLAYLNQPGKLHPRNLSIARTLTRSFTGRNMHEITTQDIRQYRAQRVTEGVKPDTVNREIGMLSASINYVNAEYGWRLENVAAGQKFSAGPGRLRWLSPDETDRLLRAASASQNPLLYPIILIAINTGMRRGELLGLRWKDIDLQARTIHLEATSTKTRKRRIIPMNVACYDAIIACADYQSTHCHQSSWIFCHPTGERIHDVKRAFSTACKRASIEDFRFHDLRHTFAARLATSGVPLAEIRDLLGHSTIQMTERYAHLSPENLRTAVEILDGPAQIKHSNCA